MGVQVVIQLGNSGEECKIAPESYPTQGAHWYEGTCSSTLQELIAKVSGIRELVDLRLAAWDYSLWMHRHQRNRQILQIRFCCRLFNIY